jgi:hypothetical protein
LKSVKDSNGMLILKLVMTLPFRILQNDSV